MRRPRRGVAACCWKRVVRTRSGLHSEVHLRSHTASSWASGWTLATIFRVCTMRKRTRSRFSWRFNRRGRTPPSAASSRTTSPSWKRGLDGTRRSSGIFSGRRPARWTERMQRWSSERWVEMIFYLFLMVFWFLLGSSV
uniref:(northern house mosquito) hypothetical protein n=1 Tax=Culex pipiens TaxID=7175 RepID=A0A8D8EYJ5_CULPI